MAVAYAARDGTTAADGDGRNSPYTRALLTHIGEAELVGEILNKVAESVLLQTDGSQEPVVYGRLPPSAYLNGSGSRLAGPPPDPPGPGERPDPAAEMWNQVRDAGDGRAVRDFLTAYPDSRYASAAEQLLAQLSQPFTVAAEPAGARVRIMNIQRLYTPGMRLSAGAYEVEVSAPGHETATDLVSHGFERPTVHRIALNVDRRHLIRSIQQGLNAAGFRTSNSSGSHSRGTERALSAFFVARGLSNPGVSQAALDEVERAAADGFRNFLGCQIEKTPRKVYETRRIPRTTSSWVDERDPVREELASCTAVSICAGYVDFYGRTMPAAQQLCGQACRAYAELSNRQGIPLFVTAPLENRCENMADDQSPRSPRISDVRVGRCICPAGSTVCSCEFRADCNYQIQSERTEYEEVVEEAMVMDEKEVCRCHAPELSGRSCVRV